MFWLGGVCNIAQLPFKPSTITPLNDARVVRPRLPKDANMAYCVAVYCRLVRCEIKETKATVANAAVKLSTITAAANKFVFGPTMAIHVNIKLVAAMAIPLINRPLIRP